MNSLPQPDCFLNYQLSNIDYSLSKFIAPFITKFSSLDYAVFIQDIDSWIRAFIKKAIISSIEKADREFRDSPGRLQRYYVKQTRSRSLITVFGEISFLRTEYVHRDTNSPYCYIDRKLAIKSRQRYDCCIEAKVKELYANHNSMIKVGEIIGESTFASFSLDSTRKYHALPRQTVYNLLHRTGKITVDPKPMKKTPKTIYIMADEKWVPIQEKNDEKDGEKKKTAKEMVKVAICFENKEPLYTKKGDKTSRNRLKNKFVISTCSSERINFWEYVLDELSKRYDLNEIKNIYILGDGASWIKSGAITLSMPSVKVKYALDRFHAVQAINRMTTDEVFREVLKQYLYSLQKEEFDAVADIAKSYLETDEQKNKFDINLEYVHTHWSAFKVMCQEVKIGCAMEQAISHIIASVFTSVPKAYGRKNLPIYLSSRILHENNEDIIKSHLLATDIQKNQGEDVHLHDILDLSFFDNQIRDETYKTNLKNRTHSKTEYPF